MPKKEATIKYVSSAVDDWWSAPTPIAEPFKFTRTTGGESEYYKLGEILVDQIISDFIAGIGAGFASIGDKINEHITNIRDWAAPGINEISNAISEFFAAELVEGVSRYRVYDDGTVVALAPMWRPFYERHARNVVAWLEEMWQGLVDSISLAVHNWWTSPGTEGIWEQVADNTFIEGVRTTPSPQERVSVIGEAIQGALSSIADFFAPEYIGGWIVGEFDTPVFDPNMIRVEWYERHVRNVFEWLGGIWRGLVAAVAGAFTDWRPGARPGQDTISGRDRAFFAQQSIPAAIGEALGNINNSFRDFFAPEVVQEAIAYRGGIGFTEGYVVWRPFYERHVRNVVAWLESVWQGLVDAVVATISGWLPGTRPGQDTISGRDRAFFATKTVPIVLGEALGEINNRFRDFFAPEVVQEAIAYRGGIGFTEGYVVWRPFYERHVRNVVAWLESVWQGLVSAVSSVISSWGPGFRPGQDTISGRDRAFFGESRLSIIEGISNALAQMGSTISSIFVGWWTTGWTNFTLIFDDEKLDQVIVDIHRSPQKRFEGFQKWLDKIWQAVLSSMVSILFPGTRPGQDTISKRDQDFFSRQHVIFAVKGFGDQLGIAINNFFVGIGNGIEEWWTSGDWTEYIVTLDDEGRVDQLRKIIHESLSTKFENFTSWLGSIWSTVTDTLVSLVANWRPGTRPGQDTISRRDRDFFAGPQMSPILLALGNAIRRMGQSISDFFAPEYIGGWIVGEFDTPVFDPNMIRVEWYERHVRNVFEWLGGIWRGLVGAVADALNGWRPGARPGQDTISGRDRAFFAGPQMSPILLALGNAIRRMGQSISDFFAPEYIGGWIVGEFDTPVFDPNMIRVEWYERHVRNVFEWLGGIWRGLVGAVADAFRDWRPGARPGQDTISGRDRAFFAQQSIPAAIGEALGNINNSFKDFFAPEIITRPFYEKHIDNVVNWLEGVWQGLENAILDVLFGRQTLPTGRGSIGNELTTGTIQRGSKIMSALGALFLRMGNWISSFFAPELIENVYRWGVDDEGNVFRLPRLYRPFYDRHVRNVVNWMEGIWRGLVDAVADALNGWRPGARPGQDTISGRDRAFFARHPIEAAVENAITTISTGIQNFFAAEHIVRWYGTWESGSFETYRVDTYRPFFERHVRSVVNWLEDLWQGLIDEIITTISNWWTTSPGITPVWEQVADNVFIQGEQPLLSPQQEMSRIGEAIGEAIGIVFSNILSSIEDFFAPTVVRKFVDDKYIGLTAIRFDEYRPFFERHVQSVVDWLEGLWQGLVDYISTAIHNWWTTAGTRPVWEEVADNVFIQGEQTIPSPQERMQPILDAINNAIINPIRNFFAAENVGMWIPVWRFGQLTIIQEEKYRPFFERYARVFIDWLEGLWQGLVDHVSAEIHNWWTGADTTDVWEQVADNTFVVGTKTTPSPARRLSIITDAISEAFAPIVDPLEAFFAPDKIGDVFQWTVFPDGETEATTTGIYQPFYQKYLDSLKDWLNNLVNGFIEFVANGIREFINVTIPEWEATVDSWFVNEDYGILQVLGEAIGDLGDTFVEKFEDAFTGVDLYDWWHGTFEKVPEVSVMYRVEERTDDPPWETVTVQELGPVPREMQRFEHYGPGGGTTQIREEGPPAETRQLIGEEVGFGQEWLWLTRVLSGSGGGSLNADPYYRSKFGLRDRPAKYGWEYIQDPLRNIPLFGWEDISIPSANLLSWENAMVPTRNDPRYGWELQTEKGLGPKMFGWEHIEEDNVYGWEVFDTTGAKENIKRILENIEDAIEQSFNDIIEFAKTTWEDIVHRLQYDVAATWNEWITGERIVRDATGVPLGTERLGGNIITRIVNGVFDSIVDTLESNIETDPKINTKVLSDLANRMFGNIGIAIHNWWTSDWWQTDERITTFTAVLDEEGKVDQIIKQEHFVNAKAALKNAMDGIIDAIFRNFFEDDEIITGYEEDEFGKQDKARTRVRPWVIKHIENVVQAIVDVLTDTGTWISILWDKFTGLDIWTTIGDFIGELLTPPSFYEVPIDIQTYVSAPGVRTFIPAEDEPDRLLATAAMGGFAFHSLGRTIGGTKERAIGQVAEAAKVPMLDPARAAATGQLGASVRKAGVVWGGVIGTVLIDTLTRSFFTKLGLSIIVDNLIAAIAQAFDTVLNTRYEEGTPGPYTGSIHEWAIKHADYVKAAVVAAFGLVFRSKIITLFGIAEFIYVGIKNDIGSLSEKINDGTLEEDINTELEKFRIKLLNVINSWTGDAVITPEGENKGWLASEVDLILQPIITIGQSITSTTFDVIDRLPKATKNIRDAFDNLIGSEDSEARLDKTQDLLEKISEIIAGAGTTFGNFLIIGSQVFVEISKRFANVFGSAAEQGIGEGFVAGAAGFVGSEHGLNSLLISAIAGTLGLAAGGPLTAAIAAVFSPIILSAITDAVRNIFEGSDENSLAGALSREEYRTALSGALGGLIAWALTAKSGIGIISAAAVGIGTAIGVGTKEGLITFWEDNDIVQILTMAMFGAQIVHPLLWGANKGKLTKQFLAMGGTIAAGMAGQKIAEDITSGDPARLLTMAAGGAGAGALSLSLLKRTKWGTFGTSMGLMLGTMIGMAAGPAMMDAMWASLGESADQGAEEAGLLGSVYRVAENMFTSVGSAYAVHTAGRTQFISDDMRKRLVESEAVQRRVLGDRFNEFTGKQREAMEGRAKIATKGHLQKLVDAGELSREDIKPKSPKGIYQETLKNFMSREVTAARRLRLSNVFDKWGKKTGWVGQLRSFATGWGTMIAFTVATEFWDVFESALEGLMPEAVSQSLDERTPLTTLVVDLASGVFGASVGFMIGGQLGGIIGFQAAQRFLPAFFQYFVDELILSKIEGAETTGEKVDALAAMITDATIGTVTYKMASKTFPALMTKIGIGAGHPFFRALTVIGALFASIVATGFANAFFDAIGQAIEDAMGNVGIGVDGETIADVLMNPAFLIPAGIVGAKMFAMASAQITTLAASATFLAGFAAFIGPVAAGVLVAIGIGIAATIVAALISGLQTGIPYGITEGVRQGVIAGEFGGDAAAYAAHEMHTAHGINVGDQAGAAINYGAVMTGQLAQTHVGAVTFGDPSQGINRWRLSPRHFILQPTKGGAIVHSGSGHGYKEGDFIPRSELRFFMPDEIYEKTGRRGLGFSWMGQLRMGLADWMNPNTISGDAFYGYNPSNRDKGGPGRAGVPYLIGTGAQPELFIPSVDGHFFPNFASDRLNYHMGGRTSMSQRDGDSTTYNVTINATVDPSTGTPENVGDRLGRAFKRRVERL